MAPCVCHLHCHEEWGGEGREGETEKGCEGGGGSNGEGGRGGKDGGKVGSEGGSDSLLMETLIRATTVRADLSRSQQL